MPNLTCESIFYLFVFLFLEEISRLVDRGIYFHLHKLKTGSNRYIGIVVRFPDGKSADGA